MTLADSLSRVDPELRPVLQFLLQISPPPTDLSLGALPEFRERGERLAKAQLEDVTVAEHALTAPGGNHVPLFVINSESRADRPAILHMHGGGFVAGSARSSVADLQILARALDCTIVTVEYRLAPETPFPGALEDNYAALTWLFREADKLGIDRARVALMGESAGGGHAAMLALAARDRGEFNVAFLALTYPMLDDRTAATYDPAPHQGEFVWTRALNRAGWDALLGSNRDGASEGQQAAAPARAVDLAGLPPTFISVGDLDLFAEEDVLFARRLMRSGVPTELLTLPGAFHGFDVIGAQSAISRRYRTALFNALARALSRPLVEIAPDPAPFNLAAFGGGVQG